MRAVMEGVALFVEGHVHACLRSWGSRWRGSGWAGVGRVGRCGGRSRRMCMAAGGMAGGRGGWSVWGGAACGTGVGAWPDVETACAQTIRVAATIAAGQNATAPWTSAYTALPTQLYPALQRDWEGSEWQTRDWRWRLSVSGWRGASSMRRS